MNEITILIIVLSIILFGFILNLVEYKLSNWTDLVAIYFADVVPKGKEIYGLESQYRNAKNNYNMGNSLLKVIPSKAGLYVKKDLKYEFPRLYHPILIPWESLSLHISQLGEGIYLDTYVIRNKNQILGKLYLEPHVTKQILEKISLMDVEIQKN